jgi:hypothetical protein
MPTLMPALPRTVLALFFVLEKKVYPAPALLGQNRWAGLLQKKNR